MVRDALAQVLTGVAAESRPFLTELGLQAWNSTLQSARQSLPANATTAQLYARLATTLQRNTLVNIAQEMAASRELAVGALRRTITTLTEEQATALAQRLANSTTRSAMEQALNDVVGTAPSQSVLDLASLWTRDFSVNTAWARTASMARVTGEPEVLFVSLGNAGNPLPGLPETAIQRAWRLEVELIRRTGRGTADWAPDELTRIVAGADFRELGYTGHHINRVRDLPIWRGDPRNIAFMRQGAGESHMRIGHPGETQAAQPEGYLIDRQAMLDLLPAQ